MEQKNNKAKCLNCHEVFLLKGQIVSERLDTGQKCPHCGKWTPVPFLFSRKIERKN